MNRADRRRLKRVANQALKTAMRVRPGVKHPAPDSVTLVGGPMDGWIVKPDAPALRPDWCTTWPDSVAAKNAPGLYVAAGPGQARWERL
jgi:hypothetical protein